MKKAYLYLNYDNVVVLKDYLDVVFCALENNGYVCEYVKSLKGISKKSLIVFPMGNDAFFYYLKGFHNIVFWQQGATAEESYLRHKSSIRRRILNFMDCFIIKRAKINIFVSKEMLLYYERLMKRSLKDKTYIMPCFNDSYDKSVSCIQNKDYCKPSFTYVGSLTDWQCFEETIDLYKQIETIMPNATITVLTFQKEEALRIMKEKQVTNYSVNTVDKSEVKNTLKDVSFGFVIRKDIIVNQVATPTKLSSYLAAGVLPIYSDCLKDFTESCKKFNISLCLTKDSTAKDVCNFVKMKKSNKEIEKNIKAIFDTYYSPSFHIGNLSRMIEYLKI